MKKLYEKFYGGECETVLEFIFGYLLLFICLPFTILKWGVENLYMKINKMHGFDKYEADPDNINPLIVVIVSAIILLFVTAILSIVGEENGGINWTAMLYPIIGLHVIAPVTHLLSNIRLDYEKKPKTKKKKLDEEKFWKNITPKREKRKLERKEFNTEIFQQSLREFKT